MNWEEKKTMLDTLRRHQEGSQEDRGGGRELKIDGPG